VLLDASTAHRVADGWTYGFAEMAAGQADAIRKAKRVSNPGCYPTGAIALIKPLIDAGLMAKDFPVTVNAVSGYSGGGKSMIADHEEGRAPHFELYGLGLEHKHVAELQLYTGLARRPIFVPSVGHFRQGMLVSVPLHLDTLTGQVSVDALHDVLAKAYQGAQLVKVLANDEASVKAGRIEAEALNNTDVMELRVYGNQARGQAVLVARLDNLGKGASGAAVQNLQLMLGLLDIEFNGPLKNQAARRRPDCCLIAGPYQACFTCWCCTPRPSIPTSIVSPPLRNRGGFMPRPTPGGVPVVMMSPASRCMNCEM
jgi:N-acetyl-gamma-glutamyl-phosphate reductase